MEKWICIYSYSMINSVQSALDTYWNKHPFCGRNLHCHMFVFQQSLLLVLYKLINPYHVYSTSRHSALKRFRLEYQSPCGLDTQNVVVVHLYYWELRINQHSALSSILTIISLCCQYGIASLCWSSPVAGSRVFSDRQIQVLWGVGLGPLVGCSCTNGRPGRATVVLSEDYCCNPLICIRFDWTASGCTCFTGHLRRWAQTSRHFSRGWATLVTSLVVAADCHGYGCSPCALCCNTHHVRFLRGNVLSRAAQAGHRHYSQLVLHQI